MTYSQIIELPRGWRISPRLMALWAVDEAHTIELEAVERTDDNRIRWAYRLAHHGRTIFEGRDMRSPVGEELSTDALVKAAIAILAFLITPSEDPEDLTPEQTAWRGEFAEDLALFTFDDSCGYCGDAEHLSPTCPDR
ncbi:hypothetical protein [Actinomadura rupiterrae]|uniref:hypothetical protein n=1 Tax=Actinomadura rupiterrae TaxID=559627 RepID=UPI0020A2E578|nr:hypothetical protein [Actinomadura rupiterrae]MCP2337504.1 hypothetical protein [Actinomadura rupiterrae]